MFKVANQVIDAYDDVYFTYLSKIAKVNPQIQISSAEEISKLRDSDFALSYITKKASKLNKFPIDNADNTQLSQMMLSFTRNNLPEKAASVAAYHIKKACDKFKVKPLKFLNELAKEASSNLVYEEKDIPTNNSHNFEIDLSKFAQVDDIANNYTKAQYIINDVNAVKYASAYFDDNYEKLPIDLRHGYALSLQKRAHELGCKPIKGMVAKYASDHYNPQLDAEITNRRSLVSGRPDMDSLLDKVAAAKSSLSPIDFAKLLNTFDKKASLSRYYGSYLKDPYQASFAQEPDPYEGYRYKTASATIMTPDVIAQIAEGKYDKIKNYFGQSVADEFKKNPIPIFESLPKDAKEIIGEMADGNL